MATMAESIKNTPFRLWCQVSRNCEPRNMVDRFELDVAV